MCTCKNLMLHIVIFIKDIYIYIYIYYMSYGMSMGSNRNFDLYVLFQRNNRQIDFCVGI